MKRKLMLYLFFSIVSISVFACGSALSKTEPAVDGNLPITTETSIASVVAPSSSPKPELPLEVTFSHDTGFYASSFDLVLSAPEGADIFYTLDGSPPGHSSIKYTHPIAVTASAPDKPIKQFDDEPTSRVDVLSINAIAIKDDKASEIATRNYVKGTDVFNRFCENTLVFVLNADPFGLYDYYEGVLVPGIDRDEWRKEYEKEHGELPVVGWAWNEENPSSPANFNRRGAESERAVYVDMFDNKGVKILSQRAGMRVKGGYTRAEESQKSLELYAREDYGDRDNFLFSFFGEEHTHDGQLINRYRRVRLRNGGSDRNAGFIRDELGQELFRQAGHADTQMHTPAAVFLNGGYYGVAWLKTPRSENHLSRRYGGETGKFEMVHGGEGRFEPGYWEGEKHAADDMKEIIVLARKGFTGEDGQERYEEFIRRMDMDSLIRYYAMQIYLNNYDWPNHNIEMWRYYPSEKEKNDNTLHPYLRDGRWRVYSHDIESGWGMWDHEDKQAKEDTIKDILTGNSGGRWNSANSSAILYAMVGHDDTKAQLANAFVDLIEGAFAPANVDKTLDGLIAKIQHEQEYAIRMDIINPESLWWPTPESYEESYDAIRRFAQLRPDVIYRAIRNTLNMNTNRRYAVNLTTSIGGGAMMHTRPVAENGQVTGNYFSDTAIQITALPYPGYVVDHWMVDDTRRTGESITIDRAAEVALYFKRCPVFAVNGSLYVSAVKANQNGWIELKNDTGRTLNTSGLFLSDSNSDYKKWAMPELTVNPGETLRVNTRNNTGVAQAQTNFNLKLGDRLRLSDENGNVLSLVEIALINEDEVQRRMNDGRFNIVKK